MPRVDGLRDFKSGSSEHKTAGEVIEAKLIARDTEPVIKKFVEALLEAEGTSSNAWIDFSNDVDYIHRAANILTRHGITASVEDTTDLFGLENLKKYGVFVRDVDYNVIMNVSKIVAETTQETIDDVLDGFADHFGDSINTKADALEVLNTEINKGYWGTDVENKYQGSDFRGQLEAALLDYLEREGVFTTAAEVDSEAVEVEYAKMLSDQYYLEELAFDTLNAESGETDFTDVEIEDKIELMKEDGYIKDIAKDRVESGLTEEAIEKESVGSDSTLQQLEFTAEVEKEMSKYEIEEKIKNYLDMSNLSETDKETILSLINDLENISFNEGDEAGIEHGRDTSNEG